MQYKYVNEENYEDFSSGRVIYQSPGMTNFPVRLMNEIFLRCVGYSDTKENLVVYDPCCGGGYMTTVLQFLQSDKIKKIYGSDISKEAVSQAEKNASLCTKNGLNIRLEELKNLYQQYQKESHAEAIKSCERLSKLVTKEEVSAEFFVADATKEADIAFMKEKADIIIADVPYGKLVGWSSDSAGMIDSFLQSLSSIAKEGAIIAICSDKHQKIQPSQLKRLEKQLIGKRKFEIYKK